MKVDVVSEQENESESVAVTDTKKRPRHESRDDGELTGRATKRGRPIVRDQKMSEHLNPSAKVAECGSDNPTDEAPSPSATAKSSPKPQELWSAGSYPFSTPDSVRTEEREHFLDDLLGSVSPKTLFGNCY